MRITESFESMDYVWKVCFTLVVNMPGTEIKTLQKNNQFYKTENLKRKYSKNFCTEQKTIIKK